MTKVDASNIIINVVASDVLKTAAILENDTANKVNQEYKNSQISERVNA